MAIGIAMLLGFRFPQNFDQPYRAASLQEFWRRWHMTLSRFLKDYLSIRDQIDTARTTLGQYTSGLEDLTNILSEQDILSEDNT